MKKLSALLWPVMAALALRLLVVVWAGDGFPATADGTYFDTLAWRMAQGMGYSWAWADGTTTPVAHYPVGYPAFLAAIYRVMGHSVPLAGVVQALFGAAGVWALGAATRTAVNAQAASIAAWLLALHPALCLYTPALMSEGVSVAGLSIALWGLVRAQETRWGWAGLSVVMGALTLLRPQFLLFAPVFGALLATTLRARLVKAGLVTALTLLSCLPWTLRNCTQMHACAVVSVNGGWNLAIGAQTESGAWQAIGVPASCANVWDEAEKDACFGREARKAILNEPLGWLSKVPAKVSTTVDYMGAAPWYLHASNPQRFGDKAKWWWGAAETLMTRLMLAASLAALAWGPARRRLWHRVVVHGSALALAALPHAWAAYTAFAVASVWRGRSMLERALGAVVGLTMLTHAVFFGAGRYGLVLLPALAVGTARMVVDHRARAE